MTPPKKFLSHKKDEYLILNVFLSIELLLKLVDASTNKLKYKRISELI